MPNFILHTPDSFNPSYWLTHGFEILWTEDGSPTLRSLPKPSDLKSLPSDLSEPQLHLSESMHHSGGAYQETQLIYGDCLRHVFNVRKILPQNKVSVLSVGLGLGYNEILTAVEALKNNCQPDQVFLCSFESQQFLTDSILKWVGRRSDPASVLYDKIAQFFINEHGKSLDSSSVFEIKDIQDWLQKSFENKSWKIFGAIDEGWPQGISENDLTSLKFNCIFYDAFSSKSSPHLWLEDFLFKFFLQTTQESCCVSTYACTGALKRALKKNGFRLDLQSGFRSKRNRTFATRLLID